MASLEELRQTRLEKLELLKKSGMDPYPATSQRDFSIADLINNYETHEKAGKPITIVGRVMSLRPQGGLIFLNIFDGTGKFQGLLKLATESNEAGTISQESFELFSNAVDIGDFIQITGSLFITKRGEKTVQVSTWNMLSKSLLPLPEKWNGLQDIEERFRKRYLDILMNPDMRSLIEKKALFWKFTRDYLNKHGFLEVETPTLELTTGGAEANPFKTHHDDYDLDVYLRISVGELWQKRLLAAGLPKTFEIGRVYRNEGTSPEHAQEFTNLEFYAAYMDYNQGIEFTETMIREMAESVFGTTKFTTRGFEFDLGTKPWPKLDYVETVQKMTGINVLTASVKDMQNKLGELKVKYDGTTTERLTDTLWKYCRKQIGGPAWLINHPKLVSPLSKAKPDNPELTERVQLLLAGAEMTNGFSELNNPIDQKERFEVQKKLIQTGDEEAMMPDDEFVEMLEHGMPPAFGFGFGERLFAFLVDKPLRETQIFPLLRPKKQE